MLKLYELINVMHGFILIQPGHGLEYMQVIYSKYLGGTNNICLDIVYDCCFKAFYMYCY